MSTFISTEYQVAIPWKQKVTLPIYPPIKLYYWKAQQYEKGIYSWKVYDRKKTVCDFVKARNKLGLEATKEVIKTYLAGPDRDIDKLMTYAKVLKVYGVLKRHLEFLI